MEVHIHAVLFAKAHEDVAGDPHLVGGILGTLTEDLEFPLALRHFSVDAFVVDTGVETEIEMLLDDLASDATHSVEPDTCVVLALRRGKPTALGEPKRSSIFVEKIFLLETKPRIGVVVDRGTGIRPVRSLAIRHHDFAHDQRAVLASGVGVHSNRREHAIRAVTFRLPGRTTVEAPHGKFTELREACEFLDLRFATEIRNGFITVEPEVFEFVFRHK